MAILILRLFATQLTISCKTQKELALHQTMFGILFSEFRRTLDEASEKGEEGHVTAIPASLETGTTSKTSTVDCQQIISAPQYFLRTSPGTNLL